MALDARFDTHGRTGPDFRGLSRDVASDFDRIFARREPPSGEAPPPAAVRTVPRRDPARRAGTAAAIGAALAAALAGLAVGVVFTQREDASKTPVARAATPPSTAVAAAQIVVPPAPAPAAVAPAGPAPVASASPAVRPRVTPPKAAPAASTRPSRAKPGTRAWRDPCGQYRGAALARCAYPSVMAADRRLRVAYDRATRAGVSRATLARVRGDWAGLRRRTNTQPQMVIGRYNRMAAELNRLSGRHGQ